MTIYYIPKMPLGDIVYNANTDDAIAFADGSKPIVLKMKPEYRNEVPITAKELSMSAEDFGELLRQSSRWFSSQSEVERIIAKHNIETHEQEKD
ncbi:hypothetical protein J4216_00075 [Candidatus Woesearchaeota archaeon]|nr:hypothetical protein [Candidatus Woesearchaeota archaeon]